MGVSGEPAGGFWIKRAVAKAGLAFLGKAGQVNRQAELMLAVARLGDIFVSVGGAVFGGGFSADFGLGGAGAVGARDEDR